MTAMKRGERIASGRAEDSDKRGARRRTRRGLAAAARRAVVAAVASACVMGAAITHAAADEAGTTSACPAESLAPTAGRVPAIEGTIMASEVRPGAVILEWTADADRVLSGFYLRLANPLPPRDEPVVAAIEAAGETLDATAAIPAFSYPLARHTRPYTHDPGTFPPLDVGMEFRTPVVPTAIRKGETVRVTIASAPASCPAGVVAGLQFQGRYPLAGTRAPFRESRTNGPVCSIPWSDPEFVAVGNHIPFDPLCAPQNNSSVIGDDDGTLYIFCAYYSVDEQYGGGRAGSTSRIFGFRKAPGASEWEPLGLVVDLLPGGTYSGDPFVFRDLDGRPCLLFTSCDGTNGFVDWQKLGTYITRSETDSFAGPWGAPVPLWEEYPREPDDNKTGGRANCVRVYPRPAAKDYLVVWNHGAQDMDVRGLLVKSLDDAIPHDAIGAAAIFVKNQEEGGGGFAYGSKGYYSTWQIPWLNDPNGCQRLYEVDLTTPLSPESWRVVPGSIGSNDGFDRRRDGGTTADAWAISVVGGRVWATSCEYSASEKRNYLVARSAPKEAFDEFVAGGGASRRVFRYGAVDVPPYHETFPTIEYAVGKEASLETSFHSDGELAYPFIAYGPSDARGEARSLFFEVNPTGAFFVAYDEDRNRAVLAENADVRWTPGSTCRLKLTRRGDEFIAYYEDREVLALTIDDSELLRNLDDNPRFRLYGWRGGRYEVFDAILRDGPEGL